MDALALISHAIVRYSNSSQDTSILKSIAFQNLLLDLPYMFNQEKQVLIGLEATEYAIIKSLLKCYNYYLKNLMISTINQQSIKNLKFELKEIQRSTISNPHDLNDFYSEEYIISGQELEQRSNHLYLEKLRNDISIKYNNKTSAISENLNDSHLFQRAYIEIEKQHLQKGQVFSINSVYFLIISISSSNVSINIAKNDLLESIILEDSGCVDKIDKGVHFYKESNEWIVECSSGGDNRLMLGVTNTAKNQPLILEGSYVIRILQFKIRIVLNPFVTIVLN